VYLCFLSCVLVWLFGALCLVNQSLLFEHRNRLITGFSLRELNDDLTLKQSNTPHTTDSPILINIYRYIYISSYYYYVSYCLLRYIIIFIITTMINTLYRMFHGYRYSVKKF